MKIYVDADACPVVETVLRLGRRYRCPVVLVADTAHRIQRPGAECVTVDQGRDAADLYLANHLAPGDILVTQDYGLAALALARGGRPLHQDGIRYTAQNIDGLLLARHLSQKARRAGKHTRGPARRTAAQDQAFARALEELLLNGDSRQKEREP